VKSQNRIERDLSCLVFSQRLKDNNGQDLISELVA